ncbi:MAG: molybdopterin molybdotransferase MoeA [Candidatus Eisenbacteria bacterium]|nr:molybdopterin molybdotransferase MoeA [Candidatus Eisenbacteria bacterium]
MQVRVLAAVAPAPPERVPLMEARGRALRRAVVAPHPLPPFDNASMDGYAVRAADCAGASASAPVTLPVAGVIPAGRVAPRALGPGEAMRIMTGAMVPGDADAVLPFEDVERLEPPGGPERVRIPRPVKPGENVRAAGADLAAGAGALAAGRELSAHDLALIASLGFPEVEVGPRPRAALLSTGDELLGVGEPLRPGAFRDSNLPMLALLLEECGARVVSATRVGDDPGTVAAGVRAALAAADVALTIGGVSAGDFDPVRLSLEAAGGAELWRVAMKPGRPQAFGARGGKLFFGLPGNPGSVACVFETLVRPALRKWQGFAALDRPSLEVRCRVAIASRSGRTDFVRATLEWRGGAWWAAPAGEQVSGHLTPQARAHALVIVPEEVERLEPGASARALLLRWPGDPA